TVLLGRCYCLRCACAWLCRSVDGGSVARPDHRRCADRQSLPLTMVRELSEYAAYLFDMDGTLTYHDQAIPGAAETLRALKDAGKHVLAVTNNSSLGQHALAERFRRFGLPLDDHEVFSALVATARFVAAEQPGARVHVFGNPGLRSEVERHGLVV